MMRETEPMNASQRQLPLGVSLIALFYLFGALVLLVCAVTNPREASAIIAVRHGLHPDPGVTVLLSVAALAIALFYGLSTLSRWGWWLTTGYLLYFGAVSLFLSLGGSGMLSPGGTASRDFAGNLIWSVLVIAYLLARRDHFLSR